MLGDHNLIMKQICASWYLMKVSNKKRIEQTSIGVRSLHYSSIDPRKAIYTGMDALHLCSIVYGQQCNGIGKTVAIEDN